jgi:hypothetical protein
MNDDGWMDGWMDGWVRFFFEKNPSSKSEWLLRFARGARALRMASNDDERIAKRRNVWKYTHAWIDTKQNRRN